MDGRTRTERNEDRKGGEPLRDYSLAVCKEGRKERKQREDENRIRPLTLIPCRRRRRRSSSYFSFKATTRRQYRAGDGGSERMGQRCPTISSSDLTRLRILARTHMCTRTSTPHSLSSQCCHKRLRRQKTRRSSSSSSSSSFSSRLSQEACFDRKRKRYNKGSRVGEGVDVQIHETGNRNQRGSLPPAPSYRPCPFASL